MLDALAQVRVDAGQQRLDNKEERKVEQVGRAAPPLEAHEEPEQVCQVHLDLGKKKSRIMVALFDIVSSFRIKIYLTLDIKSHFKHFQIT